MPRTVLYGDVPILLCLLYLFFTSSAFSTGDHIWGTGIAGIGFFYVLTRWILTFQPQWNRILFSLLIGWGIFEVIYGHLQLFGIYPSNNGLYLLTGTFSNPGPFSGFLATLFPIALSALWKTEHDSKIGNCYPLLGWIGCFCLLSLLPAGMSRAAWIATTIGGGIVVSHHVSWQALLCQQRLQHQKRFLFGAFGLLTLLFFLAIAIYLFKKDSADGRLLIWKVTTHIVAEHPWWGIGGGQFAGAYGQAQASYFAGEEATAQEKWVAGSPEYGFNEFLQITAEHGVFGLALLALVFLLALRRAWFNGQIGLFGSLCALLTFACFSYPFRIPQFLLLLALLLGCIHSPLSPTPCGKKRQTILCLSLLLILFFLLLIRQFPAWKKQQEAVEKWEEEQIYYNIQIYEGTVDNYRKLYPILHRNPRFLFEFGQCLSKTGSYEESNQVLLAGTRCSSDPMFWNIMGKNHQANGQYDKAESCFWQAHHSVPHRLYPLYLLAQLYFSTAQIEKGIAMAQRIVAHIPKTPSTAIEEMKTEMKHKLKEYQPL